MSKKIVLIVAILIGLLAGVYSWSNIQAQISKVEETVRVVVPNSDIEVYSIITKDNLTWLNIPANMLDENTVTDPDEIIEKLTIAPLFKNKPIDKRVLVVPSHTNLKNKHVVGVRVDAARMAGAVEGDLVDVYWLENNSVAITAPIIAKNARVISVTDSFGRPLRDRASGVSILDTNASANLEPQIVYLLVSPEEVPFVINGASKGNTNIAFSKVPIEKREEN